ncbi:MAG: heme-binding protein [Lachnospiraceae bacterium]|nr:heme-binding protein [Lachnospiraceae bacterium]
MSLAADNYAICKRQEERLVFDHFDNDDAWKLGSQMVNDAREKGLAIAVEIWINGYMVFRYGFNGTNNYNDLWLGRKTNTVNMFHRSTLRTHYQPAVGEDDLYTDAHLDPNEYSNMGGGFPIFVKNVGCIGVLNVSGLVHTSDHQTAVDGIAKYLGITDIERVREE